MWRNIIAPIISMATCLFLEVHSQIHIYPGSPTHLARRRLVWVPDTHPGNPAIMHRKSLATRSYRLPCRVLFCCRQRVEYIV